MKSRIRLSEYHCSSLLAERTAELVASLVEGERLVEGEHLVDPGNTASHTADSTQRKSSGPYIDSIADNTGSNSSGHRLGNRTPAPAVPEERPAFVEKVVGGGW